MGIASSDKNTIRKMSEIEAVIYDRFLSIKCPDEKVKLNEFQVLKEENKNVIIVV